MNQPDREREYERIVEELFERYGGTFTREEVAEVVGDSRARLEATATVDTYLPVFAQRFAKERLGSLARQRGGPEKGATRLLFVCNGNAGRSQMAAAFATTVGEGRYVASSAGVNPLQTVLPDVEAAMQERGIELPEAFPKPITEDVMSAADVVVGLGVEEDQLPEARQTILWDIPPVVDKSLDEVREARDDIESRVTALVADLDDDGNVNLSSGDVHASR